MRQTSLLFLSRLLVSFCLLALTACTPREPETRPAPPDAARIDPIPTGPGAVGIATRHPFPLPEDAALDVAETVAASKPNDVAAQKTLGGIYFNARTYKPAVVHFEKAMMLAPQDAQARLYLGYARLGVGDIKNGIGDIIASVEQVESPLPAEDRSSGWFEVGDAAYKVLKDDVLAVRAFREALTANPKSPLAALALGSWYATAKKYTEAKKLFMQAMQNATTPDAKSAAKACLVRLEGEQKRGK
jgi:tetratricopeptide (TPR) repeat protein